jgi:RimJ/RimL family protein N-acetyltransferase
VRIRVPSAAERPERRATMDVEIKRIAPEHIEGLHRAVDFVARERKYLAFLEGPPLESTRQFVTNIIEKGFPQFVALAANDVVGWCDVIPKPRAVYAHSGVLGMGLLPKWRRQGHGRALITTTLDAARQFGLTRIELTVYADNFPAISLYESVGFRQEGILRDAALIDGVYMDSLVMGLVQRDGGRTSY